jgi:hypothetical protein
MAEDDRIHASEEGDDVPQINVPSHDPLPPPPEIQFTRPNLGQKPGPSGAPRNEYGVTPTSPQSSMPVAVKYTTGLAGGMTLISCILGGYWLGSQIDQRWLHTQTPWATIVMVLVGTFGGFYNMFRLLKRAERLDRNK